MSNAVSTFLEERIAAGDFPSAVYLVAERGEIRMHEALGLAVVEPERIEAKRYTIYDLASLTKVLVTGLLAAKFLEVGTFILDQKDADLIPELAGTDKAAITLKQLVTHTSGLEPWVPLYLLATSPEDVLAVIAGRPFAYEADSMVAYSDLNFILLQKMIEDASGVTIAEAASAAIFEPLGLKDTAYGVAPGKIIRTAASERGNGYERDTCIQQGYEVPESGEAFRSGQIWGEVHDGNAHFLGGSAGHAGLFSTASEVFEIARQFLPSSSALLSPDMCEIFRRNLTPELNEHRSFAFQLASTPDSTAGAGMSPESFGHLGFTGTSLWIDPFKERVFILLTNRTHARALPFENINAVRRRFHDLAIAELDADS